jgi:hypothetical protein
LVAHELLGHGLTGRSLGWPIRTVVTTRGAHTGGWCEHHPKPGLSPLEEAADEVTICLAGELAALAVPLNGYLEDVDGCAERAEQTARVALERLPPDDAVFVAWVQADSRPGRTDQERADVLARSAAGEEFALFMAFCAARARRIIAANIGLFRMLLPVALANPILTGDAVEVEIERAGLREPRPSGVERAPRGAPSV